LDSVRLLQPPIPIDEIKKRIPTLFWARFPRSVTTPPTDRVAEIKQLIRRLTSSNHFSANDEVADIASIFEDRTGTSKTRRMALIEARLGWVGMQTY
jgi:hypothetical protein